MIYKSLLTYVAIGGLFMTVAGGVANAVPIFDIVDPAQDIEVSVLNPEYTFFHDLTDGIAPDLFVPAIDIIDSATISINFTDDGGSETIEITIGALTPSVINNIGASRNYSAVIPSIFDLQLDGKLMVLLSTESRPSGVGNFFFADSTLTAQVIRGNPNSFTGGGIITGDGIEGQQVPEPATFAMLSLGLAGLGFVRRKIKA